MLGEEEVQEYSESLQECGAVFNTRIVMAAAEGIVKGVVSNLLSSNGAAYCLWEALGQEFLKTNGFCQEKGEYHCCLQISVSL